MQLAGVVKECMEAAVELRVPLKVKMAVGRTWVRGGGIYVGRTSLHSVAV